MGTFKIEFEANTYIKFVIEGNDIKLNDNPIDSGQYSLMLKNIIITGNNVLKFRLLGGDVTTVKIHRLSPDMIDGSYMFTNQNEITSITTLVNVIAGLDNCRFMFAGCGRLTNFSSDLTFIPHVDARGLFSGCYSLEIIDYINIRTRLLEGAFYNMPKLKNIIGIIDTTSSISNIDTTYGVSTIYNMFDFYNKCERPMEDEQRLFSQDRGYRYISSVPLD